MSRLKVSPNERKRVRERSYGRGRSHGSLCGEKKEKIAPVSSTLSNTVLCVTIIIPEIPFCVREPVFTLAFQDNEACLRAEAGNAPAYRVRPILRITPRGLPTFQFRNWTTASKLQDARSCRWGARMKGTPPQP